MRRKWRVWRVGVAGVVTGVVTDVVTDFVVTGVVGVFTGDGLGVHNDSVIGC